MRKPFALTRGPFALTITWKQLDVLVTLSNYKVLSTREVGEHLDEIQADDALQNNGVPMWWGSGSTGARGALNTLRERELVEVKPGSAPYLWRLTAKGKSAVKGLG